MAEVNLNINGKNYSMECDDGQEQRVIDLGDYVDAKMKQISDAGAASSDSHLFVLSNLMLADEIFELKSHLSALGGPSPDSEEAQKEDLVISEAIDRMAERIDSIATRIGQAS